jgi:NADP-dependent alcohol dehydrogenase
MWCATQALNGLISCGTPQDWSTHYIGHELTAFFGLDHGESLAVVHPGVLKFKEKAKMEKLAQMAERLFGKRKGGVSEKSAFSIKMIEEFFLSIGMKTRLSDYGIDETGVKMVVKRFEERQTILGERMDITSKEIESILNLRI